MGSRKDRPSSGSVKTDPQPYGKGTDQEYRGGARAGALKAMERQALGCFDDDIRYMIQAVDTLTEGLRKAKEE